MKTYCGAKCEECQGREQCAGCEASCGRPFGGECVAASYIRVGGIDAYRAFKGALLAEINGLLASLSFPAAEGLYELAGSYVNLPYRLPSGETVTFLDEKKIYLGTQIPLADTGVCVGAVADKDFILICTYEKDGTSPVLVLYRQR